MNFIPSCIWVLLQFIPGMVFVMPFIDGDLAKTYVLILWLTTITIIAADFGSSRLRRNFGLASNVKQGNQVKVRESFWRFSVIGLLGVYGLYMISMPQWPLMSLIAGTVESSEVAELREMSSKLSKLPALLVYSGQSSFWAIVFLAWARWNDSPAKLSTCFVVLIFTGALTGAKFSSFIVFVMWITWAIYYFKLFARLWKGVLLGLVSSILIAYGHFSLLSFNEFNRTTTDRDVAAPLTTLPADSARVSWRSEGSVPSKLAQYAFYRIVLVPSDVSFRWIAGATEYGHDPSLKPANFVGYQYYYSRFPNFFLDSVSAYGSFDVDAFLRFGYTGLFLAFIAFGAVRVSLALIADRYNSSGLYSGLLIFWGSLIIQSSLQAAVIANGIALIIFCFMIADSRLLGQIYKRMINDN